MNDSIPVSNLPSNTTIRWWSGEYGARKLNEARVDVLVQDIGRLYSSPSAIKPYWSHGTYDHYPWGFGGFSNLGF